MENFAGQVAVVTGGGTGIGRELVGQLHAEGCHVSMCDVSADNMAETAGMCTGPARVTTFVADVSDESQVAAFAASVTATTDHIDLLFNNAGIGGGGSFLVDDRSEWDQTFGVCWGGVYLCSRAFMALLLGSERGHLVNTSSVNGFWASLGPGIPHTAYSAAKFAVKGFTEALIGDFRVNAPHLSAHVVMPGHIGTSIAINSAKAFGRDPKELTSDQLVELRRRLAQRGMDLSGASDEDVRTGMQMMAEGFRDNAPTTAAQAATVILDGVRSGEWRILVGDDAHELDTMVRSEPGAAYSQVFADRLAAREIFGFTR